MSVDKNKIKIPKVTLSREAKRQLALFLEHDYTTKGKCLRLKITGKGCDGLTYSSFFDQERVDDFSISVELSPEIKTTLLMDPFSAFYMQNVFLDYVFEPFTLDNQEPQEGFMIVNSAQEQYQGKFWKGQEELVPPQI